MCPIYLLIFYSPLQGLVIQLDCLKLSSCRCFQQHGSEFCTPLALCPLWCALLFGSSKLISFRVKKFHYHYFLTKKITVSTTLGRSSQAGPSHALCKCTPIWKVSPVSGVVKCLTRESTISAKRSEQPWWAAPAMLD